MDEGLEVTVLPAEDGVMIKEIIYGRLGLSRGLLRRMKRGGGVLLNGEPAFITQRVVEGDRISINFYDAKTELPPENIPLEILWEDDSLLVINKPAGLAVHPTRTYPTGTLANAIAYYWETKGYQRKVRLVHRLDRETSGVILVAKEPYAYQGLALQLKTNHLQRTYLAITTGILRPKKGRIDRPIGRPEIVNGHGLQRAVVAGGKRAITNYQVLQDYSDRSLVRLSLETGRTHQIRVHLASLGFPVMGDDIYGRGVQGIHRQALHAWSLSFSHPRTGKKVLVRANLPRDMLGLLQL